MVQPSAAPAFRELNETPAAGKRQPGKRIFDVFAAGLLLLLLSPLLALIALLIACWDGRPILHHRQVIGRNGEFAALKFRTMRPDADTWLLAHPEHLAAFQSQFKLVNDPRITRLGRWLRHYSLDELPQLWNVFRGQMSLVGPRMISPAELSRFGAQARILRTVRPGLTGYWQVYGRQQVNYAERVAMETRYIALWSWMLDLKILCLTPGRILRGWGAY